MSLTREVAALVEERGAATVDDLLPDLEEYTRAQVMSALGNAATAGLIVCDGPGPRIRRGSKPGVYRPKPQAQRPRPVASVWDFAQRASAGPIAGRKQRQSDQQINGIRSHDPCTRP